MDKRVCDECKSQFDFDRTGLGAMVDGREVIVCSAKCAKAGAAGRDHYVAIHDDADRIIEHDIPGK